ncbi:hypothetical protein DTO164E3_8672 [Paecilomyces variotii]|nr:hypothetical protein DTO164E3_8672 [Paecilomyces variotii]KAJ9191982.1 hypothetical protein DTO032I3_8546 [Paecilomyces variotii]KAJ9275419.1 hypothetical protein DTO021D3_7715 [Paecilomyces variotii]KAJ9340023.1 hypothetical protein DTO027B6_7473 [Paecilomyces variotii]KAJ9348019.1 hypothetical protein DTO027B9_8662 [Paecilomyces variotii]
MPSDRDDWEDFGFRRTSYWIDDPEEDLVLQFDDPNVSWRLGPILKERVRHGDKYAGVKISEAAGTCIATQIEGPQKGTKAIAKIRMQIPPGMDDPSEYDPDVDYSIYKSEYRSIWATCESEMLKYLTEKGSKCTPRFIGLQVQDQTDRDYVPGGYVQYLLMEKLPGTNLLDWNEFDLETRNRVRLAFAKAIREFWSYGLVHNDPMRNNIIWDENTDRCWIIDMEDAIYADKPRKFKPRLDWSEWSISGIDRERNIDPMLPDEYDEYSDDDAIAALATRTKTRQMCEGLSEFRASRAS